MLERVLWDGVLHFHAWKVPLKAPRDWITGMRGDYAKWRVRTGATNATARVLALQGNAH